MPVLFYLQMPSIHVTYTNVMYLNFSYLSDQTSYGTSSRIYQQCLAGLRIAIMDQTNICCSTE